MLDIKLEVWWVRLLYATVLPIKIDNILISPESSLLSLQSLLILGLGNQWSDFYYHRWTFPILQLYLKWNHTVYALLYSWLFFFTQYNLNVLIFSLKEDTMRGFENPSGEEANPPVSLHASVAFSLRHCVIFYYVNTSNPLLMDIWVVSSLRAL